MNNNKRYLKLYKINIDDLQEVSKEAMESPQIFLIVQGPEQSEHTLNCRETRLDELQ